MEKEDFEQALKILGYTKQSFSDKIEVPYDTILGWTKKGNKIPKWVGKLLDAYLEIKKLKFSTIKRHEIKKQIPTQKLEHYIVSPHSENTDTKTPSLSGDNGKNKNYRH
jgi:hypothetical protein